MLNTSGNTIGKRINGKKNQATKFGVTSDSIIEVAETRNHNLIVLGSRGLGTVKRFLLGSVSDDVSQSETFSFDISDKT